MAAELLPRPQTASYVQRALFFLDAIGEFLDCLVGALVFVINAFAEHFGCGVLFQFGVGGNGG